MMWQPLATCTPAMSCHAYVIFGINGVAMVWYGDGVTTIMIYRKVSPWMLHSSQSKTSSKCLAMYAEIYIYICGGAYVLICVIDAIIGQMCSHAFLNQKQKEGIQGVIISFVCVCVCWFAWHISSRYDMIR